MMLGENIYGDVYVLKKLFAEENFSYVPSEK